MTRASNSSLLAGTDHFVDRHIGPPENEVAIMLDRLGLESLEELVQRSVPEAIRLEGELDLPEARSESAMLARAAELAERNTLVRSFIGMGYHRCVTPAVIQRNVLENPGWYTQYTPYQAEIAQGRLEALLNFQTMVADLSGLPIANASLLDEGTAAAEAMTMCYNVGRGKRSTFLVAGDCHPQTLEVVATRAEPLGIRIERVDPESIDSFGDDVFGLLLQNPSTDGTVRDFSDLCAKAKASKVMVTIAADIMSLLLMTSPGEMGADVAIGSTQRFGVPMGFGGPHAAFFATTEAHKRRIPGRIVGVSRDAHDNVALRLAMQTREQHIRRDKATSNICTSQVLLAVIASMYAVYHGPEGLRRIAERIQLLTLCLREGLRRQGCAVSEGPIFDTVKVEVSSTQREAIVAHAAMHHMELRQLDARHISVSLDEATTVEELEHLIACISGKDLEVDIAQIADEQTLGFAGALERGVDYLRHPTFHRYHAEHDLLRYMYKLQSRDLSLTTSMIPLGSCTMKLNATAEMVPVTMPGFGQLHPFTSPEHAEGYQEMIEELEAQLAEITGLPGVSLQPNAGSQGEYAGLLVIRAYHHARGDESRNVCLIPHSAHGTNPASAVMSGMKVVVVGTDEQGNIDLEDLRAKAAEHSEHLAALMITYPSTYGVFEEAIGEICEVVHRHGGQVYMDGANMNAQVGLCRPGDFGIDVCHLNLHKTFCIPHGGGGPGVGPIAAAAHLAPFLPGHGLAQTGGERHIGAVASAPWGSAGILPISWMYIGMMGAEGLKRASEVAILNANYLARRLADHYDLLYTNEQGMVAHEFILDLRPLRESAGVTVADVAKRLQDYGFHAPTMSWPVEGTLMIEPTESESLAELDRYADAFIAIRAEIGDIEEGRAERDDNVLKNAPHTALAVAQPEWPHPYSREQAAYPNAELREHKFWPPVARVDDAYGDRNLFCSCPPIESFEDAAE